MSPSKQDQTCLHDEAHDQCLQNQIEAGVDATLLSKACCLGFLIIKAPDAAARDYISHEIMECQGDGKRMNALALHQSSHSLM